MSEEPLVKLSEQGEAAVLNYNVPEPTAYTGRNLIELSYDSSIFAPLAGTPIGIDRDILTAQTLEDFLLGQHILAGGAAPLGAGGRSAGSVNPTAQRRADGETRAAAIMADPATTLGDVDTAKVALGVGRYPVLVRTQSGGVMVDYAPIPTEPIPGIYLVETYRLSNFLGDYGAGKTIKTFSLLPGEKSRISITSYKNSTTTAAQASSIFDSYTEETADDFETAVQSENSDTESEEKTRSWSVEAEASGNWGVASVSVEGGASGSTNSARESFASSTSAATEKHSQTASAQRDVEVNTSTSATTEEGEQSAIEREIENINVGRTLNFVFRQMNQEYISILHLVDVRVAFWNGYPDAKMEVPLYDIDSLLEYCVPKPEDRARVRRDTLFAIEQIKDWRGEVHHDPADPGSGDNFVQLRRHAEANGKQSQYLAVNREKTSTFEGITVPGLILSVRKHVLRTDGVIVEALLGQAPALDLYSQQLQDEKVVEKERDNQRLALENDKLELALQIVRDADGDRAELYEKLFAEPPDAGVTAPVSAVSGAAGDGRRTP